MADWVIVAGLVVIVAMAAFLVPFVVTWAVVSWLEEWHRWK